MATARQKEAARRNLVKAREAQRARAGGAKGPASSPGLSTAEEDRMPDSEFAFTDERKEPLNDAAHVRNAIARFNQVENVTDAERDEAWARIIDAARRFDVDVSEDDWRELFDSGSAATH